MKNIERSPEKWLEIFKVYEKSNLGKAEFCKINDLSTPKFYYWCKKLRPDLKSEQHVERSSKTDFISIKATKANEVFSILIKDHMKIKFDSIPEPIWIAKLFTCINDRL